MVGRLFWESVWDRFDPARPPVEPAFRAPRPRGPGEFILRELCRPLGIPRLLLCGTSGVGKSTELYRVAEARAGDDQVVLVDLFEFFSETLGDVAALQRLVGWEVGFLVALGLLHAGQVRANFAWDPRLLAALSRAWRSLSDDTPLPRGSSTGDPEPPDLIALSRRVPVLASGGPSSGVQALGGPTQHGGWTLPVGTGRSEVPAQDPRIKLLKAALRQIAETFRRHRRLLLMVDGLDHIRDEARARHILYDAGILHQIPCPQLISAPFALRDGDPEAAARRYTAFPLFNEPVLDPAAPAHHGPGIDLFSDLFWRQIADLSERPDEIIPEPQLRRLAYHCGGRPRDFALAVRQLAERAWDYDSVSVHAGLVSEVLDVHRRRLEVGLSAGSINLLRNVILDPTHAFPVDPEARSLLADGRLLAFSHESEWFFPHPLLLAQRVRIRVGSTLTP